MTSLNGAINTLLVNNVVTTQVTSDLKTKLSYRYYDYDNQTPELNVANWIIADALAANPAHPTYAPVNTAVYRLYQAECRRRGDLEAGQFGEYRRRLWLRAL